VADRLREKQPKLGALMNSSRGSVPACKALPREHGTRTASTNPIERVNRKGDAPVGHHRHHLQR
jgi:transposase-like protein